ncbi:polysaccharide deacetylase family protein [Kitasatospora paracochleata]|uniref:Peptidoglycan/xylan/chitin deacetylase (PgdA/CDA1 family) n=1 Tax=Kitasatospora paracochleata TaxID=58354 RepID=A0ABT1JAU8_9ACTN|nr:polysaccharide deacetylase family protein [Kitasatospora paracochleata]MCP2314577.1 peptidoglycan/xylan/chitin deacetylase (PgdA/CDA1 family) [Kitasatospora paracochleata]
MTSVDRRSVLRAAALGAGAAAVAACGADVRPPVPGVVVPPSSEPPTPTARSADPSAGGPLVPLPAGLPFQLTSGPPDRDRVALTFHGQGSPEIATALLGEVASAGARITVLAVGTWLDEQPQLARRILDGGHELGNHTLNHGDMSALDPERAYAEIAGCAERLERLTGSKGRWFRPSRARDCTPTVAAQALRAGYEHCLGYDLDSRDFTDPGASAVRDTVLGRVRPGSIVSLHFGHQGTVAALPAILDGLTARNLRPVTATELFS